MSAVTSPQPPVLAAAGQHGNTAHSDGGWALVPVQTRSERFTSVDPAAFDAVTGLEADWKLTPVAIVRPLIDGVLDGSPYQYSSTETEGTSLEWVDRSDVRVGAAGMPEEKASANAWSTFEKALSITLSGEETAHVTVNRSALGGHARAAHTLITAKPNSNATVVLQNSGSALLSENVEIVVEDGANLTVISVQEWDGSAVHLASHFARVGRDARLKHIVVSLGGKVVRVNPSVHLVEAGADGQLFGLYFADAGQHLEQRVYVHHVAPNTISRVNYKGALNGAGARTVWVGDVLIGPDAAGTDSYEANRNLVLSEGTRADSIPNLEIECGDIVGAGHASATGRFDDEHLFYLQARGIPEDKARRLVVLGFLTEIIQKIGKGDLESRLLEAIEIELGGVAA
ncbi:iron-regulated ABC transporter permease protein SufD [Glaciihabitans tibetensis]|uniref:Iron-regulated ABC transporter permease protein SufD n=1 Tax=Glaciihabitans tibetensis TaxID=1266600 RepID=A0A2T0VJS5_9MICO|nr:Fe-S cluster assembly protein SufD [Glaciihabitans tibetensis]PRY70443.1 iron-regulated ABC transporter permease protein SufD [Glaciihabitans tibetensis]